MKKFVRAFAFAVFALGLSATAALAERCNLEVIQGGGQRAFDGAIYRYDQAEIDRLLDVPTVSRPEVTKQLQRIVAESDRKGIGGVLRALLKVALNRDYGRMPSNDVDRAIGRLKKKLANSAYIKPPEAIGIVPLVIKLDLSSMTVTDRFKLGAALTAKTIEERRMAILGLIPKHNVSTRLHLSISRDSEIERLSATLTQELMETLVVDAKKVPKSPIEPTCDPPCNAVREAIPVEEVRPQEATPEKPEDHRDTTTLPHTPRKPGPQVPPPPPRKPTPPFRW